MKRKSLCLFLAVIMLLQFVPIPHVSANSGFHDVKEEDYYAQAAIALASMKILTGYPDGSFGAQKTITRAEMTAIMCRFLGQENPGNTKTMFPDVLENHWASGYIHYAHQNGIVNGYQNGEFHPNDTVKFEEALKMIVSSCSYGKSILPQKGDWSNPYFQAGTQHGILNNTVGKKGQEAVRGDIAVMVCQALQSDLLPPRISLASGTYTERQTVTLKTERPHTEIYYTIDGSTPSSNDMRYTEPIIIEKNCTLQAISIYKGTLSSSVAKADYMIEIATGSKKNPYRRNIPSETKEEDPVPPNEDLMMSDADGDKVVLWIEELFGSSDHNVDSDHDGIDDYVEIMILHSDPTVADAESDADEDGLSNIEEVNQYRTDPVRKDTDGDGLTDSEELKKYFTDPLKIDTDDDNIYDGEELELGLNPLVADNLKEIPQVLDKSVIDETLFEENEAIPEITGTSDLILNRSISLEASKKEAVADNRAIVGRGVELTVSGNADLNLSFQVSDSSPCVIMNLTEKEGWVTLDSTQKDGKISTPVNHSGTYCVMDLEALLSLLGVDVEKYYNELISTHQNPTDEISTVTKNEGETEEISQNQNSNDSENLHTKPVLSPEIEEWMTKELSLEDTFDEWNERSSTALGQADIVFAIDTTGSMGDEISNVANNVISFARTLTSKYGVHANLALVDYKDIVADGKDSTKVLKNGYSNWYTKVAEFAKTVKEMEVNGGGDDPETAVDALEVSRKLDYRNTAKKFIILITDADYKNDNNYGIIDMEDEIQKLKQDGIIVSVVSSNSYRSLYESLYQKTGGIFADIYGNFSEELLKLAELIGKDVNEGNWILLDDYQFVSLTEPLSTKNADTDGDGLKDFEELKMPYKKEIDVLLRLYLLDKGISSKDLEKYLQGKELYVEVYPYSSNPVLRDSDFDGIDDKKDDQPKNNHFTETLIILSKEGELEQSPTVDFHVDYRAFFKDNNKYNRDLAILGSLYAADVYENILFYLPSFKEKTKEVFAETFGFQDVEFQNIRPGTAIDSNNIIHIIDPNDITDVLFGHRNVIYKGEEKEVVLVAVRGTNGTIEEWSSNFDVGAENEEYANATGVVHPDWEKKEHHKGFDVATNRVMKELELYVKKNISDSKEKIFFVVGHSRGAAIANLLGAYLTEEGRENYTYTYATPNTTTSPKAYKNIYNIVNSDDFVPYMPMEKWGFGRYGRTGMISIEENPWYKATCKFLIGEYNVNTHAIKSAVQTLTAIAKDRADCYVYRMNDDGCIKGVTISTKNYPENIKPYCFEKKGSVRTHIYQSPAFLMQLLATLSVKINSAKGLKEKISVGAWFATFDVAKYLQDAKWKMVSIRDYINHPHQPITYYFLSTVIK